MKYTLAFDIYGTLINTAGVVEMLEEMIGEKAKVFSESWRSKQLEYSFRRGLMKQYEDFSVCTKDALDYCNRLFGTDLTESQKSELMNQYKVLPAFPDVEEGLQKLKNANHKLYAFSNGSKEAIKQLLSNANLTDYFNGIVSVEDVQIFKPNPNTYEHFIHETGSQKSNTWLISSNPFDVIGSIAYGFRSVWVQRNPNIIFDPWTSDSHGVIEPSTIVDSLTDLSSTLDKQE